MRNLKEGLDIQELDQQNNSYEYQEHTMENSNTADQHRHFVEHTFIEKEKDKPS